jgi:hypothetical protein
VEIPLSHPRCFGLNPYSPFCICRKEVLLRDAGEPGTWEWPDGGTEPVMGEDGR